MSIVLRADASGTYGALQVNGVDRLTLDNSGNVTNTGNITTTGNITATSFSGSGANLTNLPAPGISIYQRTGSRAINTTYTNTTGKPMLLAVTCWAAYASSASHWTILIINGVQGDRIFSSLGVEYSTLVGVVPAGQTYSLSVTSGGIVQWNELY